MDDVFCQCMTDYGFGSSVTLMWEVLLMWYVNDNDPISFSKESSVGYSLISPRYAI